MSVQLNISDEIKKDNKSRKYSNVQSENRHTDESFNSFFRYSNEPIKGIALRMKASSATPKKMFFMKDQEQSVDVVQAPKTNVEEPKHSEEEMLDANANSGIQLSLEVTQGPVDPTLLRKKKLSREERLNAKRVERKLKRNKVLTNDEIDEGIKKFSNTSDKRARNKDRSRRKLGLIIPPSKLIGQRLVHPVSEKIFTGTSMDTIGLHPHSVQNLDDLLGISELTMVQLKTIPKALEGHDILVRSQTGSGKTLAYALPLVQKLQEIRPKLTRTCGIQAVVIVPTRELAIQTYEVFTKVLKPFTWVVAGFLTGGEKRKSEKARLRKGINIIVGTPGRLVDHLLHTATFRLDKTQFLILDEGDRLLEMGYERDVKIIVHGITSHKEGKFTALGDQDQTAKNPFDVSKADEGLERRQLEKSDVQLQTMLLSATLTAAVQKLAGLALKNPIYIDTSDKDLPIPVKINYDYVPAAKVEKDDEILSIPSTVKLDFVVVPPKLRLATLAGVLATAAAKGNLKAFVIMATIEMVDYHHNLLMECLTERILDDEDEKRDSDSESEEPVLLKGVSVFRLHGSMQQQDRTGVFAAFRKSKQGVLLATDVAGRGIDVIEVNLVVQYSPPQNIAEFVHRVGRTARAGRSGGAILFVGPSETEFIRKLEDKRIRISQSEMEQYLAILAKVDDRAHTVQEATSNLQHKFELLVQDDPEIHEKACKAFVSWVRSYSTFPRDLKSIFNLKDAHMGHYAKSFALRDPPKSFTRHYTAPKPMQPNNRLTYTERDPDKIKMEKANKKRRRDGEPKPGLLSEKFLRLLKKSKALTTSEYDSGLPEKKRKKKNALDYSY